MAKNNGKKQRYSLNDRIIYHKDIYGKFVDQFRTKSSNGSVSVDFDKLEAAENRNPKILYSSGFSRAADDLKRGYEMPRAKLNEHSLSFRKGYAAARQAYEKSRSIKF